MGRVEALYPFLACKRCPLAAAVISDTIDRNPYIGNPKPKLRKISLACVVSRKAELAAVGGLRLDGYKLRRDGIHKKAGDTEILMENIRSTEGSPPKFCPQLIVSGSLLENK